MRNVLMFRSERESRAVVVTLGTVALVLIYMTPTTESAPQYDQSFIRNNSSRNAPPRQGYSENLEDKNHAHRERHTKETQVQTTTGVLRGLKRNVFGKEKEVFVYYGIPFAKPPLGALRFKKPVPIDPWNGTLYAVNLPNTCYQESFVSYQGFVGEDMWNPNTNISEDCLYMNLWVPKTAMKPANARSTKKLPVLIWIYGGGYMTGTTTLDVYNADILAVENDVIVGSINYRVGAFGFLYLGKEFAPGNQGMYDQVVALKWVKENIAKFGGDPESITLFGESAGGGSVAFHLLSPLSRHLLTRGIIQSGPVNAPWSIMEPDIARKVAIQLIRDCQCSTNDTMDDSAAVECMRGIPAATISTQQWNAYTPILNFPSAPIIDGEFLPRHPLVMLKEGDFKKTELLIGSNKNEGTYFMLYDFMQYFNKETQSCISRDKFLEIINILFKDRSALEKEAIVFQYTHWEDINDECKNTEKVAELVGDYNFICPTNLFAEGYANCGMPVYYYYFTQRTSSNPWGQWMGVMHGDEIEYVFGLPLNNSNLHTLAEQDLSRRIMKYFTKFAATGRPAEDDIEWPPYTRNEPNYFILNSEGSAKGKGPRANSCAFWNEFMPLITPGTSPCIMPSRCGRERWDINGAPSRYPGSSSSSCLTTLVITSSLLILITRLHFYSHSIFCLFESSFL